MKDALARKEELLQGSPAATKASHNLSVITHKQKATEEGLLIERIEQDSSFYPFDLPRKEGLHIVWTKEEKDDTGKPLLRAATIPILIETLASEYYGAFLELILIK